MLTPTHLRCEFLAEPGGLNTTTPRLSWALSGTGEMTHWRIVAAPTEPEAANGEGPLWDSGFRPATAARVVTWDGPPPPRDAAIHWSVQVRDAEGRVSDFAPPARIFTGLADADWEAGWIARYFVLPAGRAVPQDTAYDNRFQARPADYLRRPFTVAERPVRAFAYVSALGLYELEINGVKVGSDRMAPGWTDYHTRVEYQVHDVTELLDTGENVIGAILGEGWYSGRVGHNQRRAGNHYGGRPALLCQLHIEHADGRIERVCSDSEWRTRQGPICYSDFLMGEMFDSSLALDGWSAPGFTEENWQPVECFTPDPKAPRLDAARSAPVREVARLSPVARHEVDGETIHDFGQNLAGHLALRVDAPAGTEIRLRHAERLTDDGRLYTENLRFAVAEDILVCRGGPQDWAPRFTFHGFQYAGITASAPADINVEAVALQTDLPVTGRIETGHPMVNQLISNIFWSQRGNFLAVPTDCPQRDERYGWSADAQVYWRTAGYFMDVSSFTVKWMEDLIDGQSEAGVFPDVAPTKPLNPYRLTPQPGAPAWGDAPLILGWDHWCRYGDRALIDRCWGPFTAWMDTIEAANPNGLRLNEVHNNYGDWLNIGPETDRGLVATAYWVRCADIMAGLARATGRDPARWDALGERLRGTFRDAYWQDGRLSGDTQTAYMLALDFALLEDEDRPAAARRLAELIDAADGHLQCGFLGVRHVCPVVSDWIAPERAVDLLLRDTYPSWGFSIKHGATTIWERWDGWTPEAGFQAKAMNSFNHYAYGAVGEWIWSRLAGIDWDSAAPGYAAVRMRPVFDARIGHVRAAYDAITGRIESHWRFDGDDILWDVALPPGVPGRVTLPEGWTLDGATGFDLAPGRHELRLRPRK